MISYVDSDLEGRHPVLNRTYMGDRFDVGDSEDLRSDGSAAACEKRRVLLRSYEKRGERPF